MLIFFLNCVFMLVFIIIIETIFCFLFHFPHITLSHSYIDIFIVFNFQPQSLFLPSQQHPLSLLHEQSFYISTSSTPSKQQQNHSITTLPSHPINALPQNHSAPILVEVMLEHKERGKKVAPLSSDLQQVASSCQQGTLTSVIFSSPYPFFRLLYFLDDLFRIFCLKILFIFLFIINIF